MAVSNTTPERDCEEGADRMPSAVIPLPGAAAAPVVQARRRGRLPRVVGQLSQARIERQSKARREQIEAINECRGQLIELIEFFRGHWAAVYYDLRELDRISIGGARNKSPLEIAEALERLRSVNADRREAFHDAWSFGESVPFDQIPDWLSGLK